MSVSDQAFVSQFEACTLDPSEFDHRGHIRLAWLYLRAFEFNAANTKICEGINRYACSLGAHDKFNRALTETLVDIINERIQQDPELDFDSFCKKHQDLLTDALGLVKARQALQD